MQAKPMAEIRRILKGVAHQDPEHSVLKVFKAQWGRLNTVRILWKALATGGLVHNMKELRQGRVGRISAQLFLAIWGTLRNREAIVAANKRLSYPQMRKRVLRLANALVSMGVRPKDRVGVMLYNQPEFIEAVYACALIGAILPPLNFHSRGKELASLINLRNPKVLIVDKDFLGAIEAIRGETPSIEHVIVAGQDQEEGDTLAYERVLERSTEKTPPLHFILPLNYYTGGTTGTPKSSNIHESMSYLLSDEIEAPKASLEEFLTQADKGVRFLSWYKADEVKDPVTKNIRSLITTPLYHAGTAVGFSPCLLLGGTAILMKKFDPEGWLALIEKERANWAFAVPTIFQKVLALPDEIKGRYNLSSMRVVISSAAPCPPEVKKAINALFVKQGAKGPVFHEYYGSSEGGLFTILVPEDYIANEQRYASVGKARAAEVIVVDKETGRLLGPYEEGLVLIRSAATMALRYLGDEKKAHENIRVVSGKEYYDDGIVGYFDEDGFLYLSSRVKEMIITGGVNIYPNEIENAILTHPSVLDAAVIPVPHETLGEVAQACIQLKPGQAASKEQILEHLEKTGLSGFKLPQDIAILDELPRFIDGKIKKRILREAYWKGVKEMG